jgi:raffinose/stachyose/melibiose transport system permease protein
MTTLRVPQASTPRLRRRHRPGARWYFVLPALAFFGFSVLYPSAQGVWFSFQRWDGLTAVGTFIGIGNYATLASDPQTLIWLRNTVLIALAVTVLQLLIGLLLALGVQSKIKSRHVLRVIFFAPVLIVSVVVAFVWQYIFSPGGPLDSLLDAVHLGALKQNWLGDPTVALGCIIAVIVWQFSGYSMIIFLAGLEGVPVELQEAAQLDGANAWQRFRSVTLPALWPATTTNVMLALIHGLTIFDVIWVMTQGGPAGQTDSVATAIYRTGFAYGDVGKATAMGVAFAVLVGVISFVQYRVLGRQARNAS